MENKRGKNILLALLGVLTVFETVARVIIINVSPVTGIPHLISLVFAALYGFWLYKKPHGNMLKYAMLLCALASILSGSYFLLSGHTYQIVKVLASAALCYSAGRLHRIDQNKYIMPVIGLAYLAVSIQVAWVFYSGSSGAFLLVLSCYTFTINFLVLMIAYFVRYKEHREAGLVDASKEHV